MNRRNFIQSLMAGAAVVMLPSLAKAEQVFEFPMNTIADLTAWMDERFACQEMEPRSFMDHKVEDLPKLYGFGLKDVPEVDMAAEIFRITPMTVAYACEGEDVQESERRLAQALQKKFTELERDTKLIWRLKPQFVSDTVTEYGKTWVTRESIEDFGEPEYVPDGVEFNFDTGAYHHVERKYTLSKVRMRLALPTVVGEYIEKIETPEGVKTTRI